MISTLRRKSLAYKSKLLDQASTAIEELENQQKTVTKEKLALNDQLKQLQKVAELLFFTRQKIQFWFFYNLNVLLIVMIVDYQE